MAEAEQRRSLAAANNRFALKLDALLGDRTGGCVWSPASVHTLLSFISAGAVPPTSTELQRVLRAEAFAAELHQLHQERLADWSERGDARLEMANGLFVDGRVVLHPAFVAATAARYRATCEVFASDTGAIARAERVNAWAQGSSHGMISRLVEPSMFDESPVVLANTLYFKAEWAAKFSPDETQDRPFELEDGSQIAVPTLHQRNRFRALRGDDVTVLELAYRGGRLAYDAVLPPRGASLTSWLAKQEDGWFDACLRRMSEETLIVELPKLDLQGETLRLRDALSEIGAVTVFDPSAARFDGVTDSPLAISEVVHQARLTLTEEGTEAAAGSAMFAWQSKAPPTPTLEIDRPFLFFIRDLTDGSILFMGRVTDPRAS